MQNNLFLRRLIIVTNDNQFAYDECFHRGVNIIRGQNSSGKSTILRFIFFPDFLATKASTDEQKAEYVRQQMVRPEPPVPPAP